LRTNRLTDYLQSSLANRDPSAACLGALNCDLIETARHLHDPIRRALTDGPLTIENLSKLLPALDAELRLARMVERIAQFEQRRARQKRSLPGAADGEQ